MRVQELLWADKEADVVCRIEVDVQALEWLIIQLPESDNAHTQLRAVLARIDALMSNCPRCGAHAIPAEGGACPVCGFCATCARG
jgi:NADH pyrophosphatase NudC (nudix superfamily)